MFKKTQEERVGMPEHEKSKRFDDTLIGKIIKGWPLIVAIIMIAIYFVRNDEKLIRTATLAEKTADRVYVVEQGLAVQTAMLSRIEDAVRQISRNQARGRGGD